MGKFVFRARAALELRRKDYEAAERELAAARAATLRAAAELSAAEATVADALRREGRSGRTADVARSVWFRNWLAGQEVLIGAMRRTLEARRAEERAAAASAMRARRRLRSLERLRERLWQQHVSAENRAEQKAFDLLGQIRYARDHAAE